MIHVRAHAPTPQGAGPVLEISLAGRENILKLQTALARCLNAAPEFGKDWFDLSDRLEEFIRTNNLS